MDDYLDCNEAGLKKLSKLKEVKIIRRRYNLYYSGKGSSWEKYRTIPLKAPEVQSTGWNSLEDRLYFEGTNNWGLPISYYCFPFSLENLEQMELFLEKVKEYSE